jgi:hypothetical protein
VQEQITCYYLLPIVLRLGFLGREIARCNRSSAPPTQDPALQYFPISGVICEADQYILTPYWVSVSGRIAHLYNLYDAE